MKLGAFSVSLNYSMPSPFFFPNQFIVKPLGKCVMSTPVKMIKFSNAANLPGQLDINRGFPIWQVSLPASSKKDLKLIC